MSADVDPLDEGIPRDGRWRPLIIPAPRGKPNLKAKLVPYTRASTFAKALDDGGGLATWKVRHAASGIAHSPDLAVMVVALGRNPDAFTRDDKVALDEIIERAHDRSGGNVKADYGTAVHSATEPGRDFDPLALDALTKTDETPGIMRDVRAYEALIEALDVEVIGTEQFVVNDELGTAGTFDHTVRLRLDVMLGEGDAAVTIPAGTVLVVDKKTGRLSLLAHAIQLAIYARGRTYNHVTGERGALDVSPQWGIVAHVPKGTGKAAAHFVDLHAGWRVAKLAAEVRAARSTQRQLGTLLVEVEAPAEQTADEDVAEYRAAAAATHAERGLSDAELRAQTAPAERDDGEYLPGGPAYPGEPVETVHIPAVPDTDEETAAIERITRELGDGVLDEIKRATTRDECAELWRKYAALNAWRDEHTEAVRVRLAELPAA